MTYGECTTMFTGLLNRRDATVSQIASWLLLGQTKLQRELRVPFMEKTTVYTIDGTYATNKGLLIPADFLELIRLVNSQGYRLSKEDITTTNRMALQVGYPTNYFRDTTVWRLGPTPSLADTVALTYYQAPGIMSSISDTNSISLNAPELIVYGALLYAGDFYTDKRSGSWEKRYDSIVEDLQTQADDDEISGGATVAPAYAYPNDMDSGSNYAQAWT